MRGVNDDEIEDFARLTLDHPWHVRFIELMPVGDLRELDVGARGAERRGARATATRSAPLRADDGSGARQRTGGVLPLGGRARAPSASSRR